MAPQQGPPPGAHPAPGVPRCPASRSPSAHAGNLRPSVGEATSPPPRHRCCSRRGGDSACTGQGGLGAAPRAQDRVLGGPQPSLAPPGRGPVRAFGDSPPFSGTLRTRCGDKSEVTAGCPHGPGTSGPAICRQGGQGPRGAVGAKRFGSSPPTGPKIAGLSPLGGCRSPSGSGASSRAVPLPGPGRNWGVLGGFGNRRRVAAALRTSAGSTRTSWVGNGGRRTKRAPGNPARGLKGCRVSSPLGRAHKTDFHARRRVLEGCWGPDPAPRLLQPLRAGEASRSRLHPPRQRRAAEPTPKIPSAR